MPKTNSPFKLTENEVPEIARTATAAAYKRAVRVGSVLVSLNGELRRIEAGGRSSVVKKLEPRVRIAKGSKFVIKSESA